MNYSESIYWEPWGGRGGVELDVAWESSENDGQTTWTGTSHRNGEDIVESADDQITVILALRAQIFGY